MFCCVVVLHDDDADLTLHFTLFMSQLLILQKHLKIRYLTAMHTANSCVLKRRILSKQCCFFLSFASKTKTRARRIKIFRQEAAVLTLLLATSAASIDKN